MPPPPTVGKKTLCFPVVRLSVHTYFVCRDIYVPSGGISMKLATNSHHVSWNCWKDFQAQRSEIRGQGHV